MAQYGTVYIEPLLISLMNLDTYKLCKKHNEMAHILQRDEFRWEIEMNQSLSRKISYSRFHRKIYEKLSPGLEPTILVINTDESDASEHTWSLFKAGFKGTIGVNSLDHGKQLLADRKVDIVFFDLSPREDTVCFFDYVQLLRTQGFEGIIVMLVDRPTLNDLYCAAISGVSDVLIKGRNLDLKQEAIRLMKMRSCEGASTWNPSSASQKGLLYSLGLTGGEIRVLTEFAQDFSRQYDIAKRMGLSEAHVRRTFSRIYKKLEGPLSINNQAQLSHLLTICAIFQ